MGNLRLLLAQLGQRRGQAETLQRQFERQMDPVTSYGSHGQADLDQLLALVADVDAKLEELGKTLGYLSLIEKKARPELESVELTKVVQQARAEVASLEKEPSLDAEQQSRVRDLRRIISEASEEPTRRIAGGETQGSLPGLYLYL